MRGCRLREGKTSVKTQQRNLITDVDGISVGHAHDEKLASGVTVVLAESAAVTAASIFGAPRELVRSTP